MSVNLLEGRLVRLRAREPSDEETAHRAANDPSVQAGMGTPYGASRAAVSSVTAARKMPRYSDALFSVEAIDNGAYLGGISIESTVAESRSARLGLTIEDVDRWGHGFGTDATRVACRFAFEQMNIHRIELDVYETNVAAIRLYEKAGFVLEGRRREAHFWAGRYVDILRMSLLEGELRWE